MADLFISYSRQDRQGAERIARRLEAEGWSVWWDQDLVAGEAWNESIGAELKAARAVVVLWSAASWTSRWVQAEAHHALERNILAAARLDDIALAPPFNIIQAADVRKDGGLEALMEGVRRILATSQADATPAAPVRKRVPATALWRRPVVWAGGALAAVLIAGAAFLLLPRAAEPGASAPTKSSAAKNDAPPHAAVSPASIAVLPFEDLSPAGDQAYFSDGIAEEILNVLVRVNRLKVASRTSSFQFRNNKIGIPAIAKELGVRHILEGSVRRAGETVRITAQLIDAQTDTHLWSETYDRPLTTATVFAIQDEIANAIVERLTAAMSANAEPEGKISRTADTANVGAYDLYLKGRALFIARGSGNLKEAARVLGEAIAIDPKFARAWETLGAVYAVSRAWELVDRDYEAMALDAADKALALNADLSLPYAVRGNTMREFMAAHSEYRWEDSLANLDQAIARDPNDATAHLWRGLAFIALGYFDRAVQDMTRCLELDPAYGGCWRWMARAHLYAGRTDEALRTFERAVERGVPNLEALFPAVYAKRGNRAATLVALADTYSDQPRLIAPLYRALTDPTFSETERKEALTIVDAAPAGWLYEYETRLFLRDYDRIRPERNVDTLLWYREDAGFLKSEARKKLMRQYRFPEYWRKHGYPPQCRAVGADDSTCD